MLPPIVTYFLSQSTENQNSKCVKVRGLFVCRFVRLERH